MTDAELAWFQSHPCPPDVIGINYYITGERLLDERVERFPRHHCGGSCNRVCEPVEQVAAPVAVTMKRTPGRARPLLVTGARGTLGRAFARLCAWRDLTVVCLGRHELDITDASAVAQALSMHRPWAVVNACGYVRVEDAEQDEDACLRSNTLGAEVLAHRCAAEAVPLLAFSSDLVFDGRLGRPYLETDAVNPLNVYGRSKVRAEHSMLTVHDRALVVRTSAFFGPWDDANFIAQGLRRLSRGETVVASDGVIVSPTYVPDLVHACLDLLIDGETGVWHLCNEEAVTWAGWLTDAARRCGIDGVRELVLPGPPPHGRAQLPRYSALASIHGPHLPTLDSAMERFCRGWRDPAQAEDQAPVAVRRCAA